MPPSFLVSLCNTGKSTTHLLQVDTTGKITPAAYRLKPKLRGATGWVRLGDRIIISLQSRAYSFAVTDENLNRAIYLPNGPFHCDLHGLVAFQGHLYSVRTARNEIWRLSPDLKPLDCVNPNQSDDNDTLHINDLCVHKGRLVASQFGARRNTGKRIGCVFDVLSGEVLFDGFTDPHSVTSRDGLLYVLDSATGSLFELETGQGPRRLLSVFGYARGLYIDDDWIVIGKSVHRTDSRSRRTPLPPLLFPDSEVRAASGRAGVYVYERRSGDCRFIDTTRYGGEVYRIDRFDAPQPAAQPATSWLTQLTTRLRGDIMQMYGGQI
ncbi:hypothetical protein ABI_02480 [Asticcacaulis biprosthecium C19]|uniref:Conserved hypothetical protein CHP03032 domain-containing protein n=1 Tax=Asticcacaulis biprosthecium C19 TaxID=715226 RepID=F4QIQ7_9CAUL|nr:DUF4915 domain-containing protein [Asticcacaulis biprosthecium]EGF91816.1 hypothetical protein ABI_02480 [Asticcacaulis biprosthecium C19]